MKHNEHKGNSKMMNCNHGPVGPEQLDRVKKPFSIRIEWLGKKPIFYTMKREDVAHCLMHVDEMRSVPSDRLRADITKLARARRPEHGLIIQALFYLCTQDPIYEAVGGVPTVDFALVRPLHQWAIQFGKQDPDVEHIRMIQRVINDPDKNVASG
jgi:hypothetical protein